jgi:membrane protease YdiL (CAAX protease family)
MDGLDGLVTPVALARFVLYLVAPLAIVLLVFRDDPRRYALALGDWRWGAGLLLVGLAVMTPIILWLSGLEAFRAYYGQAPAPLTSLMVGGLVELVPAEFLLRGFLMFALWRRIGPLALVVALVPFVLTHVGKPDLELWSTFVGGSVFAWLDWRTGSILWSAIGHVYVLTLMTVAVGGAALG